MKKIYLVICISLVCVFLSGCFAPSPNPHLTIQDHSWTKEYNGFFEWWTAEIIGHALNDGNVTLKYAEIWAKFYNANNAVIAEWLDNTVNLKVGEVWQFSINYWDDTEPDHYELWVGTLTY